MINLDHFIQSIHIEQGRWASEDKAAIQKIVTYIEANRDRQTFPNRYLRAKETGLNRAVHFTLGTVFVYLNHATDPILHSDQSRTLQHVVDISGRRFLSASSSTTHRGERLPMDHEKEMLKKVQGKEGWIQLVSHVLYHNKRGVPKRKLLLEYCNGGDLFSAITREQGFLFWNKQKIRVSKRKITSDEKRVICQKVVTALQAFHADGGVHGDLKPENVCLIRDTERRIIDAKIVDLCGAFITGTPTHRRPCMAITTAYCSPDYEDPDGANCTAAHDMWSLGAILHNLFHFEDPRLPCCDLFSPRKVSIDMLGALKEQPDTPMPPEPEGPVSMQYIASRLVRVNPDERLTAEQIAKDWMPRIQWPDTEL